MVTKHAAAAPAAAPPYPDLPLPPIFRWSISDAWTWLGHAWTTFIHLPYLGLIALVLLALVLIRAVQKLLA